jgi:hypothetical protein
VRSAAISVVGFVAVFAISLLTARGSHGPDPRNVAYCGSWRPGTPQARRYVAYAHDMDCTRGRALAAAYAATHRCRRTSTCKARVDGTHCLTAGSAGRLLGWVACGRTKHIFLPRVTFSVDRR